MNKIAKLIVNIGLETLYDPEIAFVVAKSPEKVFKVFFEQVFQPFRLLLARLV